MGSLRDLIGKGKDHEAEARKIAKPLAKDYPILAEILGGLEEKGDQPAVSPGTVTIFIHEGKARFSVNVKSSQVTFIGDLGDILNPWGSINSAIALGDVSRKRYTERKDSMTAEQEKLLL